MFQVEKLPYFLNPFIMPNAGIFLSYFNVGVAIYILQAPLSYYLIDELDVSSTNYNAYFTLVALPWSLKFILGSISDGIPIFQYRRKSWLLIGWILYILSCLCLAMFGRPSFIATAIFSFLMTCSYILADVCNDALCVERARHEQEEIKGAIQTAGYTIRAYGCIVGATLGTMLYNTATWGWGLTIAQLLALSGLIPLTNMIPSFWSLEEIATKNHITPSFKEIYWNIFETLQLKAVWYPMIFIYTYYIFQIPNGAWTNFLVEGLEFSDFELGLLTVSGALLYWVGMMVFKLFLFDSGWRNIYLFTSLVNFVFSIGQVVLILRYNKVLGIPDIVFALGDSAIMYFLWAINSMPTSIMFVMLCPEGSEGVTYALLTTIANLAWSVSFDIGTAFTSIWDVSNAALQKGDFTGVLYLTLLTSFLQLLPLSLLFILPNSRAEQRILRDSGEKSWLGGVVLLAVVVASIVITIIYNAALIMF